VSLIVKALWTLPLILLLAACGSQSGSRHSTDNGFVAADTADDVIESAHRPERGNTERHGLKPEEEADAALLVHRLGNARGREERDTIMAELVALGPKYVPFLNSIDRDDVLLDLMFVVRRIEREHGPAEQPQPQPAEPEAEPEPRDLPTAREVDAGLYDDSVLDKYDREAVEQFMADRLQRARQMVESGRYDAARQVCEAAITLLPDTRHRAEFESVLLRARGERQSALLIAGTMNLEMEHVRYESAVPDADFEAIVWIHCYLKNVSSRAITLRLNEGEGRESLLLLAITYDQLDVHGVSTYSVHGNLRIPVLTEGSVTLQPGDTYKLSLPLETLSSLDRDAPLKPTLGRADIEATLRFYGAKDSNDQPLILQPVRFTSQRLLVFPSTFDLEEGTRRPLTEMRRYLEERRPQQLFMCAHLVDRRYLRNAGDLLLADIEESAVFMQQARLQTMHALFGVGSNWDMTRWHTWWQQNRLRY
jgi:hypothetical protein